MPVVELLLVIEIVLPSRIHVPVIDSDLVSPIGLGMLKSPLSEPSSSSFSVAAILLKTPSAMARALAFMASGTFSMEACMSSSLAPRLAAPSSFQLPTAASAPPQEVTRKRARLARIDR